MRWANEPTLEGKVEERVRLMQRMESAIKMKGATDSKHGVFLVELCKGRVATIRNSYKELDPSSDKAGYGLAALQAKEDILTELIDAMEATDEEIKRLETAIEVCDNTITQLKRD